ncbi:hypothetical protein WN55_05849 [Dufourea novaeangliae]|uniref:Uncharacterized protein n=1 Tax=Dufourea novaeangliae TaxID=178035 RepID=A0A154P091_DUFNO|nr:hypothetical protein WN55_05849 [Dufourea novaeangliae]
MAKLLPTIWALLLNVSGLPIFRTCFDNAMEDEDCESLLLGPPLSSFFFSLGVYIIILDSTLFPRSFREPKVPFLILYELLHRLELEDAAVAFFTNKSLMAVVTYTVSLTFFLVTLHITDAVDYTIIRDDGAMEFMTHVKEKLWEKLQREIPFLNEDVKPCRCKSCKHIQAFSKRHSPSGPITSVSPSSTQMGQQPRERTQYAIIRQMLMALYW